MSSKTIINDLPSRRCHPLVILAVVVIGLEQFHTAVRDTDAWFAFVGRYPLNRELRNCAGSSKRERRQIDLKR
jgi:hypothetical protein